MLNVAGETPIQFLRRHISGDWGDLSADDVCENELYLKEGFRLLSAYRTAKGQKIWIITEADRSSTTILTSRTSITRPLSVPVSLSSAEDCYPCRKVPLNYNRSFSLSRAATRVRFPYGTPIVSITYAILPFCRASRNVH